MCVCQNVTKLTAEVLDIDSSISYFQPYPRFYASSSSHRSHARTYTCRIQKILNNEAFLEYAGATRRIFSIRLRRSALSVSVV